MYRDADEFVRGQKVKLALIGVLLFLVWVANGFHFHGMFK
jgi:hypothetical protein